VLGFGLNYSLLYNFLVLPNRNIAIFLTIAKIANQVSCQLFLPLKLTSKLAATPLINFLQSRVKSLLCASVILRLDSAVVTFTYENEGYLVEHFAS